MAMVTVHQWPDAERGLRELRRVSRGPVVILTFDGDALDEFWLAEYAPELIEAERQRYPAIDEIRAALGGVSAVTPVPVPIDCVDGFTEAFYARPGAVPGPGGAPLPVRVGLRGRDGRGAVGRGGCARTWSPGPGTAATARCAASRSSPGRCA